MCIIFQYQTVVKTGFKKTFMNFRVFISIFMPISKLFCRIDIHKQRGKKTVIWEDDVKRLSYSELHQTLQLDLLEEMFVHDMDSFCYVTCDQQYH